MIEKLDIKRFGLATGGTCTLAYAGCVTVMLMVPHETTIRFFNSLMHGVDVEPIIRWDVPVLEMLFGLGQTFVLGWLFGALFAAIYNMSLRSSAKDTK